MAVIYLSALVEFLDRDMQEVKKAILYPITRVELYSQMGEDNPTGKPHRVFVVGKDGLWKEVN